MCYTPSDCFETFPFPENWTDRPDLEAPGREYHDYRAELMQRNGEGLTKTYNRFHDPAERDPAIVRLRELHADLDRAVLTAYGWTDLPTACDFFPIHPDDTAADPDSNTRKKPPKCRYRWPDEVEHEILARLLERNTHHSTSKGAPASGRQGVV